MFVAKPTSRPSPRAARALRSARRLATRTLLLLPLLAGFAGAQAAPTAAPDVESVWGYDLAHELMSPFCPGRTLASCPSPQAAELVQWIVLQEASGATKEEVIEQLIARHGEEILGAPPAEGITLWAYVFPVFGILAGAGIAFIVLRRIVAGDRETGAPAVVVASGVARAPAGDLAGDDELARIVDADLAGRS